MKNIKEVSDKNLYKIAKKWGAETLHARRKFAGLMPEIHRRELREREAGRSWFNKLGFSGVYEFAAKLAGMSKEQVDLVLRLEKRFADKPVLKSALISGQISANKLARVAVVASADNQKELLEKTEMLSNRALEVFVKDLQKPKEEEKSVHVQTLNLELPHEQDIQKLNLDEDVLKQLLELQEKGININEFLRAALKKRTEEIEKTKTELSKKEQQKAEERAIIGYPAPRYINVKIRQILTQEFGTKCAAPNCQKPAKHLHHQHGFAKTQNHDPLFLKPLCMGHHELEHLDNNFDYLKGRVMKIDLSSNILNTYRYNRGEDAAEKIIQSLT
jgi:hypothetical protein